MFKITIINRLKNTLDNYIKQLDSNLCDITMT